MLIFSRQTSTSVGPVNGAGWPPSQPAIHATATTNAAMAKQTHELQEAMPTVAAKAHPMAHSRGPPVSHPASSIVRYAFDLPTAM